jgi:tellurite resistance protein TerC
VALDWTVLAVCLAVFMGADLWWSGFNPRPGLKGALRQAAVWGLLAAGFGAWVAWRRSATDGVAWASGYLLELSLSVDNLFVFLLIFQAQAVPPAQRRKALAWGVFGAMGLRLVCVGLGARLVARAAWVLPIFGAFLLFTGLRLMRGQQHGSHGEGLRRALERRLPMSGAYDPGGAFWVRQGGRLLATPLLLVVLMVEASDLLFATDSIPAVFGVTHDPFVAFSSNAFAVLGLRALYFALEGLLPIFKHLNKGLAVVLALIGLKMVAAPWATLPHAEAWTLGGVAAVLGGSVLWSILDKEAV